MDFLVEQVVVPNHPAKKALYIFIIITVAILVPSIFVWFAFLFDMPYFIVVAFFIALFSLYGIWFFMSRLKISYEYSYSFGKLSINKIIDNRIRKNIINVEVNRISSIALLSTINNDFNYKIYDVSESPANINNTILIINSDKDKETTALIITPEKDLLSAMKSHLKPDVQKQQNEIIDKLTKN